MARPRRNPDEKIKKRIPIGFSNTDIILIKKLARKKRIPVSTLIRNTILEKFNNE